MYNTNTYQNIFKPFFDSCYKKEVSNTIAYYKKERDRLPSYGIVCYIYENEYDDNLLFIIDKLKEKLGDERYREFFVKREYSQIEQFMTNGRHSDISSWRINRTFEDIIKDKYELNKQILTPFEYNDIGWVVLLLEDLYDDYKESKLPTLKKSNLEKVYKKYDITTYQSIKNNYGLFPIDDKHLLYINYWCSDAKIHDTILESFLILDKKLPIDYLEYLIKLYDLEMSNGRRFDLALLPDYDVCDIGMKNVYICKREIEFGSNYQSNLKKIVNLSRLYSNDNYEDFWVILNETGGNNSLTFEERIKENSDIQTYFKTQVVHLTYKEIGGKYFVNHLDHEFVFYSHEDFIIKLNNSKLKGKARKRIKTFKIDNAMIELTNEISTNIIFRTIHSFFKRHDLVDEYFGRNVKKVNETGTFGP